MRIGVIGAGAMAEALGGGWAAAGHEVFVGARDPGRAAELAKRIGAAGHGRIRQAAAFGDVNLLAVPGQHAAEVARSTGGALTGRPVIDCTNAFVDGAFADPPLSFLISQVAVAEQIAAAAPGAPVVKALSLCAAEVYACSAAAAAGGAGLLLVPICTDHPAAYDLVAALVRDLNLKPVNAGGLARARLAEAMTAFVMGLWFSGVDARSALPPLAAAFAVPDGDAG